MEQDLKSLARRMVSVANTLAGLGASIYFVLRSFSEEVRSKLPGEGWLALMGGLLLVLNLARLLYLRAGKRPEYEGPLLSQTEDGIVHVSREAIEAGLRSAGESLEEVTRLRVKVLTPAKRRVVVRVLYLAPEGVQILKLSSRLRKIVTERFRNMVQMDREGKLEIEIIFEGFYGKPVPPVEPKPLDRQPIAPLCALRFSFFWQTNCSSSA